jgi:hypothetical protein
MCTTVARPVTSALRMLGVQPQYWHVPSTQHIVLVVQHCMYYYICSHDPSFGDIVSSYHAAAAAAATGLTDVGLWRSPFSSCLGLHP